MNTATNASADLLKKELAEIENKRQALTKQIEEAEKNRREELQNKISNLPAYFGVPTMNEALDIIKNARNAKFYRGETKIVEAKTWGRGRRIPRDVREAVIEMFRSGNYTAIEIAKKMKVSPAAANKLKKQAGLVNAR